MGSNFQFVDGYRPSRSNQRLIRSHAMKGKNAGRSVHRASRLSFLTKHKVHQSPSPRQKCVTNGHESTGMDAPGSPGPVLASLADGILSCSLPVEFTPATLQVVGQFFQFVVEEMYPTRLGGGAQEYQYLYLRSMFPDEGTAKCSIALMDATNAFFVRGGPQGSEGLQHYSTSLAVINNRLRSGEALSDSTIMLIVLLVLQEQMRQEIMSARVHYEGLKKMIELRGGLARLENNVPMVLKICKMDVCFALYHGGPIFYSRDDEATILPKAFSGSTTPILSCNLDSTLYDLLLDSIDLSNTLNKGIYCPDYHRLDLQRTLVTFGCRLLRFQAVGSGYTCSETDAVYHIALLLFTMTLFFQYDGRGIWRFPLVSQRLKDALTRNITSKEKECNTLILWASLMGAIWTMADGEDQWIVSVVREMVHVMEIADFDDMLSRLGSFPWVHSIHDGPARSLWNTIRGGS